MKGNNKYFQEKGFKSRWKARVLRKLRFLLLLKNNRWNWLEILTLSSLRSCYLWVPKWKEWVLLSASNRTSIIMNFLRSRQRVVKTLCPRIHTCKTWIKPIMSLSLPKSKTWDFQMSFKWKIFSKGNKNNPRKRIPFLNPYQSKRSTIHKEITKSRS